ncbi:MAG: ABC transporter ATP-binding protein [Pseudomonadota bacterium]
MIDPQGEAVQTLRRLITGTARLYFWRYCIAVGFMAVTAAATAATALIMENIINDIFINRDEGMVYVIAAVLCGIYLVKGAASYGQLVIMGRINNAIVARLQRGLYERLVRQSVRFYEHMEFGEIALRIGTCAHAAREVLNLLIVGFGRDAMKLAGLLGVMIYQDWQLTIFALLTAPPAILGVSHLVRRMKKVVRVEMDSFARIMTTAKETKTGIRVIKAFNLEDRMRDIAFEAIATVQDRGNKGVELKARTSPIMETLGGLAVAGAVLYAGVNIIDNRVDPGSFVSFVVAMFMAYEPAKKLARLNVTVGGVLIQAKMMFELLDEPIDHLDRDGASDMSIGQGRVECRDLWFSYGEEPVLRGLSLTAETGTVTALVGPSGAGKSTVFSLIERFVETDEGRITIDGIDIWSMTGHSLRSQIAYVTQETYLFEGSIEENIALGNPNASKADIVQAAKDAHAHEFILEQDNGYETDVGEGGMKLSGGQRQRVAIARAMLRNAPILLLDEATASLDAESEAKVQEALDRLMKDRTTIVIAHRLATIRRADKIYVMDKGRVVQSGTHDSLIRDGGLYANLYNLQFDEGRRGAA